MGEGVGVCKSLKIAAFLRFPPREQGWPVACETIREKRMEVT